MDELKRQLENATLQIARAKEIVSHQTAVVKWLRDAGIEAALDAENSLRIFSRTLKLLEDHQFLLRQEIVELAESRAEILKVQWDRRAFAR